MAGTNIIERVISGSRPNTAIAVDTKQALGFAGLRRVLETFTHKDSVERTDALEQLRIAIVKEQRQFEGRTQLVPVVNYSPDDTIATLRAIQEANGGLTEGGLPNPIYFCEGNRSEKPVMAVMGKKLDLNDEKSLLVSFSNFHLGAGIGISFKMLEIPRMHIEITDVSVDITYPAIHETTYFAACHAIKTFAKLKPQPGLDRSRLIESIQAKIQNVTPK